MEMHGSTPRTGKHAYSLRSRLISDRGRAPQIVIGSLRLLVNTWILNQLPQAIRRDSYLEIVSRFRCLHLASSRLYSLPKAGCTSPGANRSPRQPFILRALILRGLIFWLFKGLSVQVLFNGIEAVMVLTFILLK